MTSSSGSNMWRAAARQARDHISPAAIDIGWRALNYLCAAQLYLTDNPTLTRPLRPADVKESPSGHWGTCPPVNLVLAHLGPIVANAPKEAEVVVVHGAGHAGPAALAQAYLSGELGRAYPQFQHTREGLLNFVAAFPHPDHLGSEITPLIPGHIYMGGQLGPALPFAHGAALDAPHRLVVPLIGDGECETGATAAAWLGARALIGTGDHGIVMPIILLNGQRMGARSLLSGLTEQQLHNHLSGLGYKVLTADGRDTTEFQYRLAEAIASALPLEFGPSSVLICTLPKGHTGPEEVAGRRIAGTPAVHKTPLRDPRRNRREFEALREWLSSYRPADLFDSAGVPVGEVIRAIRSVNTFRMPAIPPARECVQVCASKARQAGWADNFGGAVSAVLSQQLSDGSTRLFSPDELSSNRLDLAGQSGVIEILNEELCQAWAQGYVETGRRAVVATYEAFAPLVTSLVGQHLKYRRLASLASRNPAPSIVYLLTSLGWHNTYTHQNPVFVSALLAHEDPAVHVHTPADAARAAASLTFALGKQGRLSIVVASKHNMPTYPLDVWEQELRRGLAIWPHCSDSGTPDIVMAAAGDVPAQQMIKGLALLRAAMPDLNIRFVGIHDVSALGPHATWPLGLDDSSFAGIFGTTQPVLVAVPFLPDTARSLLWQRPDSHRFQVVGYHDPGRPLSHDALLKYCGMDSASLSHTAQQMINKVRELEGAGFHGSSRS